MFNSKPPVEDENPDQHSELLDWMLDTAESMSKDRAPFATPEMIKVMEMWLRRECHLAIRRAHEMMADGIPPDSAFFVAVDDMGFQLAHGLAQAWRTE